MSVIVFMSVLVPNESWTDLTGGHGRGNVRGLVEVLD
jgi:hypothetical protein